MRILLSEGSGLTSRQVATRLGDLGHEVELLSSTRICLTRFTHHVQRIHLVPPFGTAPTAWFEAALRIAGERSIDLLFPTQEQVAVLSALRAALDVATVVPSFESLCRVQDKISACLTLQEIGMPQPFSIIAKGVADLEEVRQFPVFVKRPISTASMGVRKASSRDQLAAAAQSLGLGASEVLVQTGVSGGLAMVQAVADHGQLLAHHACLRVREGVAGGASLKESVDIPGLPAHLEKLMARLHWHGPLSMDVILTEQGPLVIDVNPRLVEPMNAYLAGVDLVSTMLDLARQRHVAKLPPGKTGVRSCQLLLAILGVAAGTGSRTAIARELVSALGGRGDYADAVEELTPLRGDLIAAVPLVAAALATMAWPALWRSFRTGAVGPYSLTPEAWQVIVREAKRSTPSIE